MLSIHKLWLCFSIKNSSHDYSVEFLDDCFLPLVASLRLFLLFLFTASWSQGCGVQHNSHNNPALPTDFSSIP